MSGSFLCGFVNTKTEIIINLVAIMYVFEWNLSFLSVVSLGCAIIAIVMKNIQRFKRIVNIYFMFEMSVVFNNVSVCLQLLTIHAKLKAHIIIQIIAIFCFNFINVICGYIHNIMGEICIVFIGASHMLQVRWMDIAFFSLKLDFVGFFTASYIFRNGFHGYIVNNLTCLLTYVGLLYH